MHLAGSDFINARQCLRDYWRQGAGTVSGASAERTSGTPPIGGRGTPCGPVSVGSSWSNHRILHPVAQPGVMASATGHLAAINATVVSIIRLLILGLWRRPPLRGLTSRAARGEPPPKRMGSMAAGYFAAINATVVSSIRLLNPHSLSYQLETLTRRPETLVSVASKIDERASWLKSLETSGSVL